MRQLRPRVEVVAQSDEAMVGGTENPISVFQTNQRALMLVVGLELSEDEMRRQVGDVVVDALKGADA